MGSRAQSTVGCSSELCFFQFSVAHVLVGLRKQFIQNFVFPLGPVPMVVIIIIIIIIVSFKYPPELLNIHLSTL